MLRAIANIAASSAPFWSFGESANCAVKVEPQRDGALKKTSAMRRPLAVLVCLLAVACGGVDFYEVLGVARTATTQEIRKAYRVAAAACHPDKLPPETSEEARTNATAAFVELALAHEVLSDIERRRAYDETGADDASAAEESAEQRAAERRPPEITELELDVTARFRRGAFVFSYGGTGVRKVADTRATVVVTLEELLTGVARTLALPRRVRCGACGGTGSALPPEERPDCPLCEGTGRAPHLKSLGRRPRFFRQMVTTLCGACHGRGKVRGDHCPHCEDGIATIRREVVVDVPPGAPTGHEIVFKGAGDEHAHGRATGDLVVVVQIADHPVFSRSSTEGEHLICNASVGLLDALIGFDRKLTGLDGARLHVAHSRIAFASFTHELRGAGLPVFGNATERGSLTVFVRVSFPPSLTELQRRVLRRVGLRDEELDFIRILQALMAYQYAQTVRPGSEELVYSTRCHADAADACVPDPRYWSWWRAVV